MLVLNKKRILFFCMCLIVAFGSLRFKLEPEYEVVQVSATPVSGRVIILDAGHGQPDRTGLQLMMGMCLKNKLIYKLF
jgi:hypothetical protein